MGEKAENYPGWMLNQIRVELAPVVAPQLGRGQNLNQHIDRSLLPIYRCLIHCCLRAPQPIKMDALRKLKLLTLLKRRESANYL